MANKRRLWRNHAKPHNHEIERSPPPTSNERSGCHSRLTVHVLRFGRPPPEAATHEIIPSSSRSPSTQRATEARCRSSADPPQSAGGPAPALAPAPPGAMPLPCPPLPALAEKPSSCRHLAPFPRQYAAASTIATSTTPCPTTAKTTHGPIPVHDTSRPPEKASRCPRFRLTTGLPVQIEWCGGRVPKRAGRFARCRTLGGG
jgi:hypothetical protein